MINYLKSSIGRKQIVAVTGLLMIGFLIGHLAGNLLIYLGPETFNAYAKKLTGLRPALYIVEAGLAGFVLVHLFLSATLFLENRKSRPVAYQTQKTKGKKSLATRLMPYTGTIIIAFIIWHLIDFTFADKYGDRSILPDGKSYGLYGVVFNAFADPIHSLLYILAVCSLGLHLDHGVQSVIQTFGFHNAKYTPMVKKFSCIFSWSVVMGYCSIPIYIFIKAQSL